MSAWVNVKEAAALADKRARQAKEALENALWEGHQAEPFPGH